MFNKLNWFIAYRYLVSRQENSFVSFITIISTLGVTLGIAVLIIVTSVLNGFKQHIEQSVLEHQNHIIIEHHSLNGVASLIKEIKQTDSAVSEVYPLISEPGLIAINNNAIAVKIISSPENVIKNNSKKLSSKSLNNVIKIDSELAGLYDLKKGDKIVLASPVIKNSVLGPQPRFKRFVISEVFINKSNKYLNSANVIMDYETSLKFFGYEKNYISAFYVFLQKPLMAYAIKDKFTDKQLFKEQQIKTWQDNNAYLFQAIKLERVSIIMLLIMIIAIACFNILSGLFIQVSEKQKDIAILGSLGLTKRDVSIVFLLQGVLIAIIGGLLGVTLGAFVTYNLDSILYWLQSANLINSYNSFFNAISNHVIIIDINYFEMILIFVLAIILCLLATIIPAKKSSRVSLVEVLRND